MKKIIKIIGFIFILCIISVYSSACTRNDSEKEDRRELGIGNGIEIYRVPFEEVDCDYKEGDYLAIEDGPSGSILYIPDCYGEIIDVLVKESGIDICYVDLADNQTKDCTIPIIFLPNEVSNVLELSLGKSERILMDTQTDDLPLLIWKEQFIGGNSLYEIEFERISPIYRGLFREYGELLADYSVKVVDEKGKVISDQILTNFPVQYEEMHWFIDFSDDGFPDLAFCTQYILAEYSSTATYFLIWNMETLSFQQKKFPIQEGNYEKMFRPLWNTKLSTILFFAGNDTEGKAIMQMYAYSDDEWEIIRGLEPVYEESQYEGYREVIYKNNKIIDEHRLEYEGASAIWFDANSVWCKDNIENIQLYPGEEWQEITVKINGITWKKYVKQ